MYNRYVSFCTGACSDGVWLRADYLVGQAMPVKLGPVGGNGNDWGYCTSPVGVPEQINVQIGATPDTAVLSFVTFEATAPTLPPAASVHLGPAGAAAAAGPAASTVHGVTHTHVTSAGDRTYYMHFVRLSKLKPRARYSYVILEKER